MQDKRYHNDVYASDAVMEALGKALFQLDRDLQNKLNVFPDDNSRSVVIPAVCVLASASIYFEAIRKGHARKKAVRQLGQQLQKLEPIYKDCWTCYNAVFALLNGEPQSKAKPKASKSKRTGKAVRRAK